MTRECVCFLTSIAITAGLALAQQTPAVISATSSGNNGAAPNGIASTTSELLFTQPYCPGQQSRGVYSANIGAGTATELYPLPQVGTTCSENYLTIATSEGGFTAGDTYATGVSVANSANEAVYKNGSLFIDGIPASKHHAGITFDTAGTFGFNLIVTAEGSINGYNASGVLQFTYTAPANYIFEGGTVAPLTYPLCPGCLFITGVLASNVNNATPSGAGAIFYVTPGTPSGSPVTLWSMMPDNAAEPEGTVFVGNNLSCSLGGYSYFVSGYANLSEIDTPNPTTGAILGYTPAQLSAYKGQLLVPVEGSTITTPTIYASSGPNQFTTFSQPGYQLEGSTLLTCASGGCPATFGYFKHFGLPGSMFVNGSTSIGCQTYTAAQLAAVLTANNAGGNAVTILGHQLIAAIANYDAGAKQTAAASAAISAALALLCANHINLTSSFVAASSALGQQMTALANTLDAYNSSAPSCEGTGLTH